MNKIKTAIVPVAGTGTRFLPVTKSIPKEMLPILNIPTLHLIIKEAYSAGIEKIVIVYSKKKTNIKEYFEIDENFNKKSEDLNLLSKALLNIKIEWVLQEEPLGLGHAVMISKDYIKEDAFALLLGDDLIINSSEEDNATKQLINHYENYNEYVIGVQPVDKKDISKYGIVESINGYICKINEKPLKSSSNLAIMGRYILPSSIFSILEKQELNAKKEIELTEAISKLISEKNNKFVGLNFIGQRFDIGNKLGFVKANIYSALQDPEIKDEIITCLKEYLSKEEN